MELKASWSLLIRGIKSSIPRLPMVSDRLSARRNGLAAARHSGYSQVFNFHPSNTSRSVCQRLITHKLLANWQMARITANSLRSVLWSEDKSFVNSQNKTSRYHPVRRHPTSTGDASPASCQPMSCCPIGPTSASWCVLSFDWLNLLFDSNCWGVLLDGSNVNLVSTSTLKYCTNKQ